MKFSRKLIAVFITLIMIFCVGCTAENNNGTLSVGSEGSDIPLESSPEVSLGTIKLHFIDVGQGDSAFIELSDNRTMLVDAGESDYGATVIKYIKKLGYSKIDYVVATHPHSDHIGGMEEVIKAFDIGSVYMPKASSNTKTFEGLLSAIQNKKLKINTAKNGVKIIDEQDICIDVLSPVRDSYNNLNNYSVVLKITYKDNKFLFTGDAEADAENDISADVSCDLIKVGHHGSNTSSSKKFAAKTGAKYAVISCGKDNSYGHPHTEIVNRWENLGAKIYRTDINGTVIATSDGKSIKISCEETVKAEPASSEVSSENSESITAAYVLNVSTKKIHLADCRYVKSIKDSNRKETTDSLNSLLNSGYSKCKTCMGG